MAGGTRRPDGPLRSGRWQSLSTGHAALLARRIAPDDNVTGMAYVVFARNGGVGVAERVDGHLGYQLLEGDGGRPSLDLEWDWSAGPPFGTVIPLLEVTAPSPLDKAELLPWLLDREEEYAVEVAAAWKMFNPARRAGPEGSPQARRPYRVKRAAELDGIPQLWARWGS